MENLVGLKDLRLNMEKYAQKVKAGQSFVVIKKNKPLFRLSSINENEKWEEVIDFTKIKKSGVNIDELLAHLSKQKRFTAVYQKSGKWYLGWIEEISGVNTQGKTIKEVRENLREAISLIIETNKIINEKEITKSKIIREPLLMPAK
jgi:predicted RNase H-like HicB family nuclease/antitoxin (DNA-binding transcriptional repressor) of toxin-antitoxin stability system